jgi:hypothetical protein
MFADGMMQHEYQYHHPGLWALLSLLALYFCLQGSRIEGSRIGQRTESVVFGRKWSKFIINQKGEKCKPTIYILLFLENE